MEVTEIGAEGYYFDKLWEYWSNKCTAGDITELQMESKIDKIESMSTMQRKRVWEDVKL